MTRLRATASHTIPERPPIQVSPGQQVQAGQRDTDWPAFVFITTDDGAGWVPERHLDTSSDPAVVTTAYDTTELATTAGEELAAITCDDPSGWAWAATRRARRDGYHCAPSSRSPGSNRPSLINHAQPSPMPDGSSIRTDPGWR